MHVAIDALEVANPQTHVAMRGAVEELREIQARLNRLAVDAQDDLAGKDLRLQVIGGAAGDDVVYFAARPLVVPLEAQAEVRGGLCPGVLGRGQAGRSLALRRLRLAFGDVEPQVRAVELAEHQAHHDGQFVGAGGRLGHGAQYFRRISSQLRLFKRGS